MAKVENLFTKIAAGRPIAQGSADVATARTWFREQAKKIASVDTGKLFEQSAKSMVKSINITSIGSLYSYYYDPKWKEKLPYYDTFPLSFIVEITSDGFTGINVHYLPPYHRAKLMDALYGIALGENEMMKLQISYQTLKSAAKFGLFKACYKRYLNDHVRSKFMFIEPSKWDIALMLPTARFAKGTLDQIYKDSMRIGR